MLLLSSSVNLHNGCFNWEKKKNLVGMALVKLMRWEQVKFILIIWISCSYHVRAQFVQLESMRVFTVIWPSVAGYR